MYPRLFFLAFTDSLELKLDVRIMVTLYRLFWLNVSHSNMFPPFCASSKLKPIHISVINYISVLYPLLLILLTWVCVELHGRNFRPLVWLWRPFHRCFVRLRRGWDTKSDIVDVFTTFFLLSYDQLLLQTLMLVSIKPVLEVNESGKSYIIYHSILDPKSTHGQTCYLLLIISAFLVSFIFNFLPPLFLILYPIKAFRSCLSKCRLNSVAVNIFVEKMHGCYRNGLDGGQDMRSFSGLYFILRIVMCLSNPICMHHIVDSYAIGVLLLITTLAMALAKPYKKAYMNYLDVLLLFILSIQLFTVSLCSTPSYYLLTLQLIARVLLAIPFVVIVLYAVFIRLKGLAKKFSLRRAPLSIEAPQNSVLNASLASKPLVQPTSTVLSYGTIIFSDCDN